MDVEALVESMREWASGLGSRDDYCMPNEIYASIMFDQYLASIGVSRNGTPFRKHKYWPIFASAFNVPCESNVLLSNRGSSSSASVPAAPMESHRLTPSSSSSRVSERPPAASGGGAAGRASLVFPPNPKWITKGARAHKSDTTRGGCYLMLSDFGSTGFWNLPGSEVEAYFAQMQLVLPPKGNKLHLVKVHFIAFVCHGICESSASWSDRLQVGSQEKEHRNIIIGPSFRNEEVSKLLQPTPSVPTEEASALAALVQFLRLDVLDDFRTSPIFVRKDGAIDFKESVKRCPAFRIRFRMILWALRRHAQDHEVEVSTHELTKGEQGPDFSAFAESLSQAYKTTSSAPASKRARKA